MGVIKDLDEPDLEMVEIKVAARHSGMPGTAAEADLQETCHLSSLTAEVRKLKNPSWRWQEEQKTFRLRGWFGAESASARLCLSVAPWSEVDNEN
jgi:hypothetical protein